jgi:hypothetical protein
MKTILFKLTIVSALALWLAGCGEPYPARYALELPQAPETWVSLLGEPRWRIEWVSSGGEIRKTDIAHGQRIEIDPPVTWTNAVIAWPCWPESGLIPGFFRPAGGLFPFDTEGKTLRLSWEAGPDAVFYWEMAYANDGNTLRIPANFDWPRFRELFRTDVLNEAVRNDPWLADWRYIAEKTVESGFDRRRLVPETSETLNIPVPGGTWYGNSPFAGPFYFPRGTVPHFPVRPGINVWVSTEGILRCNGKAWVLTCPDSP